MPKPTEEEGYREIFSRTSREERRKERSAAPRLGGDATGLLRPDRKFDELVLKPLLLTRIRGRTNSPTRFPQSFLKRKLSRLFLTQYLPHQIDSSFPCALWRFRKHQDIITILNLLCSARHTISMRVMCVSLR